MKHLLFLSLPLLLLFVSCSDNEPTWPSSIDDQALKSKIIGTWKDIRNYSITFYSNNTFVDSIYFEGTTDTSHINYGLFVRSGKYSISNAVLELKEFHFDTLITKSIISLGMYSTHSDIAIENNQLRMVPFMVFNKTGAYKRELLGEWTKKGWYCQIDSDPSFWEPICGPTFEKYTFYEDSTNCRYTEIINNLINDTTYTYTLNWEYVYTTPYLDIPSPGYYNLTVKFDAFKMYWYFDTPVWVLDKII